MLATLHPPKLIAARAAVAATAIAVTGALSVGVAAPAPEQVLRPQFQAVNLAADIDVLTADVAQLISFPVGNYTSGPIAETLNNILSGIKLPDLSQILGGIKLPDLSQIFSGAGQLPSLQDILSAIKLPDLSQILPPALVTAINGVTEAISNGAPLMSAVEPLIAAVRDLGPQLVSQLLQALPIPSGLVHLPWGAGTSPAIAPFALVQKLISHASSVGLPTPLLSTVQGVLAQLIDADSPGATIAFGLDGLPMVVHNAGASPMTAVNALQMPQVLVNTLLTGISTNLLSPENIHLKLGSIDLSGIFNNAVVVGVAHMVRAALEKIRTAANPIFDTFEQALTPIATVLDQLAGDVTIQPLSTAAAPVSSPAAAPTPGLVAVDPPVSVPKAAAAAAAVAETGGEAPAVAARAALPEAESPSAVTANIAAVHTDPPAAQPAVEAAGEAAGGVAAGAAPVVPAVTDAPRVDVAPEPAVTAPAVNADSAPAPVQQPSRAGRHGAAGSGDADGGRASGRHGRNH